MGFYLFMLVWLNLKINHRQKIILAIGVVALVLVLGRWSYFDQYQADHLVKFVPATVTYYVHINWPWGYQHRQFKEWLQTNQAGFDQMLGENSFILRPDFLKLVNREIAIVWQVDTLAPNPLLLKQLVLVKVKQSTTFIQWAKQQSLAVRQLSKNIYLVGHNSTFIPANGRNHLGQTVYAKQCLGGSSFCGYFNLTADNLTWLPAEQKPLAQAIGQLFSWSPMVISWQEKLNHLVWQIFPNNLVANNFNYWLWQQGNNLPAKTEAAWYNFPAGQWLASQFNLVGKDSLAVRQLLNLVSGGNLFWSEAITATTTVNFLAIPAAVSSQQVAELLPVVVADLWPEPVTKRLPDNSSFTQLVAGGEFVKVQSELFNQQSIFYLVLPNQQTLVWWQTGNVLIFSDSWPAAKKYLTFSSQAIGFNFNQVLTKLGGKPPSWGVYLKGQWLAKLGLSSFRELILKQENRKIIGFLY